MSTIDYIPENKGEKMTIYAHYSWSSYKKKTKEEMENQITRQLDRQTYRQIDRQAENRYFL